MSLWRIVRFRHAHITNKEAYSARDRTGDAKYNNYCVGSFLPGAGHRCAGTTFRGWRFKDIRNRAYRVRSDAVSGDRRPRTARVACSIQFWRRSKRLVPAARKTGLASRVRLRRDRPRDGRRNSVRAVMNESGHENACWNALSGVGKIILFELFSNPTSRSWISFDLTADETELFFFFFFN